MKIVITMDSFKGSLSSSQACRIVAQSLQSKCACADLEIVQKLIADGGEGTAEAMLAAKNGTWITQRVTGPLSDMETEAGFVWFEKDKMALVEMAAASGLPLLRPDQYNPLKTSTFGTGQLIDAATRKGAQHILLAVGGSATVDGGTGAAAAIGWRFLDQNSQLIQTSGGNLQKIKKIIPPAEIAETPEINVLCDVENPLLGPDGAAKIFGPQKGATPEMVVQLENGLRNLADVVQNQLAINIDIPRAGAAGGLAAGAVAFMNAKLVSGIDTLIECTELAKDIRDADWIITGEGSFDSQSLNGKVISGILKTAGKSKAKIVVLPGISNLSEQQYKSVGITDVISARKEGMSLNEAITHAEKFLAEAAREFAEKYLKN